MYVIGTAGHVDHGKSLLVEAVTGIDPDRLPEEKARGMTIDLGFAWLTLPSGRTVSIVDVPGHERFIKNMLAGAGGVDLALLVVAADDGVMPQTREHLAILDLLDVRRGVVALTKRDLVDDGWLAMVAADIEETLTGTALAGSPVVPCSSVSRAGLDDLMRALDVAVDGLPPKRNTGRPRLPIDRVFTIGGFGTVVTGTLIDGELAAGDEIEVVPGGLRGRVRGLQSHRDKVERALPGTRTAVNISGIARDALRRGLVLTTPGWLRPSQALDVRLRAIPPSRGARQSIRYGMRITFHSGADEAPAHVRLLDRNELRPGEEGWAQLRLEAPVAVVRGDRFVVRTPNDTAGGGVIVDTTPRRHRRSDAAAIAALDALLAGAPEDLLLSAVERNPFVEASAVAATLPLAPDAVSAATQRLVAVGALVAAGDATSPLLATPAQADAFARSAIGVLRAFHARHPLRGGMPREELRQRLGLTDRAFDAAASMWPDVRLGGATAALVSHAPAPSLQQQAAIDAYLETLRANAASPPTVQPPDPELLAYLVETGAVVDAGEGVIFEAHAFGDMAARVRAHIGARGSITLAEARDLFGTSRKYAQALLEHLDRTRVTRRVGDSRVLR